MCVCVCVCGSIFCRGAYAEITWVHERHQKNRLHMQTVNSQSLLQIWLVHMSHKSVRQIPGSGSVNSIHPEKNEIWTEIQSALCVRVSILCVTYWLNRVYSGHRESQVHKKPCEGVEEDKKGHGGGKGRWDKSCLCFLSHTSPLRRIHLHTWKEKALPSALLSVLLKHKQAPLSGPDNSRACLLRTAVCVRVSACRSSSRRKNQIQQFEIDVNVTAAHHSNIIFIYHPAIRPKGFSPRCRKNKQTVTSCPVTEGFILPLCRLSRLWPVHDFISARLMHQTPVTKWFVPQSEFKTCVQPDWEQL